MNICQFTCFFCEALFEVTVDDFCAHIEACDRRQMKDPTVCPHLNHFAFVNVARIEDKGGFYADVRIHCLQCGVPFHFPGVPGGLSPRAPRVDPFAVELRAPIKPGRLPFPIESSTFEMMPDQRPSDEPDEITETEQ